MNQELAKSIGAAARAGRKRLKLTQEDASEAIAVSTEFYARIERGTSLPSVLTFARIVSVLGVSADALLGSDRGLVVRPPPPPEDTPGVRKVIRELRRATPNSVLIAGMVLRELRVASDQDGVSSDQDG